MKETKKHSGTKNQLDAHVHEILKVLRSIDSHLASMVYEATPGQGFSAGAQKIMAQPFIDESKNSSLAKLISEEIRNALGEK